MIAFESFVRDDCDSRILLASVAILDLSELLVAVQPVIGAEPFRFEGFNFLSDEPRICRMSAIGGENADAFLPEPISGHVIHD